MTWQNRPSQSSRTRRPAGSGGVSRRDVLKRGAAIGAAAALTGMPAAACEKAHDALNPVVASTGNALASRAFLNIAQPTQGGTLTMAVISDPCTLDTHVNSCTRDSIYHHALFDHLLERSPDGTIYPGLATEWAVAEDDVTWTLTLREGVTFHDGTPFNAEAVVANFERIVDPDTRSEYAVFQLGPYESSRAIDEYTVELKMTEPYGALPVSLATYGMAMMSPTAMEEYGDQIGQNPVGSGPFMFQEWTPQNQVVIVRNPDYNWASPIHPNEGPSALDEIVFRIIPEPATRAAALLSGEVDMASVVAADYVTFEGDDNYRTQTILTEGYPPAGLFINTQRPPTDDVLVRRALAFGVNRHEVNQVVYEGVAADADSVMSTFSWAYDPASALYDYDPEQAEALLDEAGWTMGDGEYRQKDGEELQIVHLALTGVRLVAETVQAQLREIGVNVELLVQDNPAQQQSGQEGVHNLVWTQWSGVDPADLRKIFHSENIGDGWNFSHYNNPEVDQMFVDGAAVNEEEARKEIYSRLQMTLMEDGTFIPLNNLTNWFVMRSSVMGTDVIDERGANPRAYDIYIEE